MIGKRRHYAPLVSSTWLIKCFLTRECYSKAILDVLEHGKLQYIAVPHRINEWIKTT